MLIQAYLEGAVLPPLPEHSWSPRATPPKPTDGPMLRRHEADVLAFIRARLAKTKAGTPQRAQAAVPEMEPVLA